MLVSSPGLSGCCRDHYIGNVGWAGPGRLLATFLPRSQTSHFTVLCSGPAWTCNTISTEHCSPLPACWLENRGLPLLHPTRPQLVAIQGVREGGAGRYPQLVRGGVAGGGAGVALTRGRGEVTALLGWDPESDLVNIHTIIIWQITNRIQL